MDANTAIAKGTKGLGQKRAKRANTQKYNEAIKRLADVSVLSIDKGVTPEDACAQFKKDPHVEYCQPNYKVTVQMTPNDTYYATSGAWGQSYPDMWGTQNS